MSSILKESVELNRVLCRLIGAISAYNNLVDNALNAHYDSLNSLLKELGVLGKEDTQSGVKIPEFIDVSSWYRSSRWIDTNLKLGNIRYEYFKENLLKSYIDCCIQICDHLKNLYDYEFDKLYEHTMYLLDSDELYRTNNRYLDDLPE